MTTKTALDYAAEMFNYDFECGCGRSHRVNARKVRPDLRITCSKCRGVTIIDATEASRINAEFNDAMRQVAHKLGVPFQPFPMPKARANAPLKPRQPKGYPVGLVGESFYQAAVKSCRIGDRVRLLRELGNPHDARAIAVENAQGQTLGYIPRDSFVHRLAYDESGGCSASVLGVNEDASGDGMAGIVLDVIIDGKQVGVRHYSPH